MDDKKIEVSEKEFGEMVERDKTRGKQMDQMMLMIKKLTEDGQRNSPMVRRNVTDRKVRLKFIDGKCVIGFKNRGVESKPLYIYQVPDLLDPTKRVMMVDLILDGEKEPLSVNYSEFLSDGETRMAVVKEKKVKEWVKEDGFTKKMEIGANDWSMVETEFVVPVEVKGENLKYVVELGDGTELTIDEAYVNI